MKDKLTIKYNPSGESGNIFWIIAAANKAYKAAGGDSTDLKPMLDRVFESHSYDDALAIIGEYFNLEKEDK